MPGATDEMVARLRADVEERTAFINGLVEAAQSDGRDLNANEMELVTRANDRLTALNGQIGPLGEATRVANEARERLASIARDQVVARNPAAAQPAMEYRSAGQYVIDRWRADIGVEEARQNIALYHRAAAHQTVADNPGLIPEPIVGGVLNFIDSARPLVTVLGPTPVPAGRFTRPKVTQHTQIAAQSAEKAELVSRKMLISELPVTPVTYGGYVNVSRQNIDWSVPSIMDVVINDLAAQYAIETENVTADALDAAATIATDTIAGTDDAAAVSKAIWGAAGQAYAAVKGVGRLVLAVAPDMLGMIGPLFPNVNPSNQQGSGFSAASFAQGPTGNISGITVVMSAGLATGTVLMISTAAAEVYEQRIGSLQVVEPSVLGVQVAYAGHFAVVVVEPGGVLQLAPAA